MGVGDLVLCVTAYRSGDTGVIIKSHPAEEQRVATHSVLFWDESIVRLAEVCLEVLI